MNINGFIPGLVVMGCLVSQAQAHAADAHPAQTLTRGGAPERKMTSRSSASVYPTIGTIERLDPSLDTLLPPNAGIEVLASGFSWAEGPVWVRRGGYLLFSDIPRNVVFKWREGEGTRE